MTGDIWQCTPFIFIVMLAALESVPEELLEAGVVDAANRWQLFKSITFPAILPATTTVVLIRITAAFKIVDLPTVLTTGALGTATYPFPLHAPATGRAGDNAGPAPVPSSLVFVVLH